MERVRAHVLIDGRVQGVNFRAYTREQARAGGVEGWVRNLDDGRVEAVFEGSAENVDQLVGWSRKGPRHATVVDIAVQVEQPEGLTTFRVE
jgi:acylphosphatase